MFQTHYMQKGVFWATRKRLSSLFSSFILYNERETFCPISLLVFYKKNKSKPCLEQHFWVNCPLEGLFPNILIAWSKSGFNSSLPNLAQIAYIHPFRSYDDDTDWCRPQTHYRPTSTAVCSPILNSSVDILSLHLTSLRHSCLKASLPCHLSWPDPPEDNWLPEW